MAKRYILKPPLPFVGNKFRWHRILRPIIESLPRHAVVFDAFGGCFAVSRMVKDFRTDCVCICNDYGMLYRKRLDAVENTNRILALMWEAGECLHPLYRYVYIIFSKLFFLWRHSHGKLLFKKFFWE